MTKMNVSFSSIFGRFEKATFLSLAVVGLVYFISIGSASAQDRTNGATLKSGPQAEQAAGAYAKSVASTLSNQTSFVLPASSKGSSGKTEQIAGFIIAEEFTRKIYDLNSDSVATFNAVVNALIAQSPDDAKAILRASNNVLNVIRQ